MSITYSHDDEPFATGVETTMTSSFSVDIETETVVDQEETMDKTQSGEEEESPGKATIRPRSPLKISYEKPRIGEMHLKTVSHIVAVSIFVPLTIETLLIFCASRPKTVPDQNGIVGCLDVLACFTCAFHVAMLLFFRSSTQLSSVLTCWSSIFMTLLLIISGFYIWTGQNVRVPQITVPLHYFCAFGSVISLILASAAVYIEHEAMEYAITY